MPRLALCTTAGLALLGGSGFAQTYPPAPPPGTAMPSPIPGWSPPSCKLEPGGGPMRCADPNNPNSFYGLKRFLFGYVRLPIEGRKEVDPLCFVFVPQQSMPGLNAAQGIQAQIDPDFPTLRPYYQFITYTVDFAKHEMVITDLMPGNGTTVETNVRVPLYDEPQADWPCRPRNFEASIGSFELDPGLVPNQRPAVINTPLHKIPDVRTSARPEAPPTFRSSTRF